MAATVEDEVKVARRVDPFGEDGFDDQDEDLAREPRPEDDEERPAFVPLSADVAPQMNLFGEPEPAPAPMAVSAAAVAEPERDEPGTPLYARRAGLRTERQKLVGSLRRMTGEPFAQINARVNGKAGVTRVEDATVDQLQRSIGLLLDELTAASRRRCSRRGAARRPSRSAQSRPRLGWVPWRATRAAFERKRQQAGSGPCRSAAPSGTRPRSPSSATPQDPAANARRGAPPKAPGPARCSVLSAAARTPHAAARTPRCGRPPTSPRRQQARPAQLPQGDAHRAAAATHDPAPVTDHQPLHGGGGVCAHDRHHHEPPTAHVRPR